VADAAGCRLASAQRLREARAAWGWSQNDLAAEVDKIRAARGLKAVEPESLRRQIIAFEKGRNPGPVWRSLLADALQDDEDRLFGLVVDAALPRPLLVQTLLNSDVLGVILAQRAAHIRAEHLFGPEYARDLVHRDLTTIEELIPVTPHKLRYDVRRLRA
jgi:transcriptional regulator with XRE-family HTH domain